MVSAFGRDITWVLIVRADILQKSSEMNKNYVDYRRATSRRINIFP